MTDTITFYSNPMSRGRIVHWMLEEVGAPYETMLIDLSTKEQKSLAYLQINPMGKIPSIVHRGVVVTEAAAICAYLADAFPQAGLAPALHDPARGTYLRWLFFAASCVEPAVLDRRNPRISTVEPGRLGYGSYHDTIAALEIAVADGYILGSRFSAADVYVASQIGWAIQMKDIEPRPIFERYLKLCFDRPALHKINAG